MSAVLEIEQAEFEQAIQEEGLVVIDFSAKWCGPCQRMLPEVEAAANEFAGKAKFLKIDVDESPEVATRYGVQGIPNLTFLRGGQVVDVAIGGMPRSAIAERVRRNL